MLGREVSFVSLINYCVVLVAVLSTDIHYIPESVTSKQLPVLYLVGLSLYNIRTK